MNSRDRENSAQPDGFTDRTSDLASKHAHEQGWRIIEVVKATTSKAKSGVSGSKLFARAGRPAGNPRAEETPRTEAASVNNPAAEKVEKMTSPLVKRSLSRPNVIWVRNKLEKNAA